MTPEISVHARPTNNKARIAVCACFISALIILTVSALVDKYKGVLGFIMLIALTSAIFIYVKFLATKYIYDLTTSQEGAPILIARSITGKRESTLMRIELAQVILVERLEGDEIHSYRTEAGVLKYVYSPTLMPEALTLIKMRAAYQKADILIEAPKEFEALIKDTAEKARELFALEDEE